MKIRVGYGLGNLRSLDGPRLGALAEAIEHHGFDSLWLSERISGPSPDPERGPPAGWPEALVSRSVAKGCPHQDNVTVVTVTAE